MSSSSGPAVSWSTDVDQADWIAERLIVPDGEVVVASNVPGGFDAYSRLLHPVTLNGHADGLRVRWSDVAAWSGRPLEPDSQFHAIALPGEGSEQPPLWGSATPRQGSLEADDARALIEVLGRHTGTPGRCWFCLWDGYGWGRSVPLTTGDGTGPGRPDPIPAEVRDGPRLRLPGRDYLLYSGPIEAALAFLESEHQSPNLFWPEDRAWCVASEIDATSTYVGGSSQLGAELIADRRIEARAVEPTDASFRVAPWVVDLVETSVDTLISSRRVAIDTEVGFVYASLSRSRFRRRGTGTFAIATARADGARVSRQKAVRIGSDDDLRAALVPALTHALVQLAGG